MISSIHVGSTSTGQTVLETSILGFDKNSNGIFLSKMKSKANVRFAKASAFLFFPLGIWQILKSLIFIDIFSPHLSKSLFCDLR